MLLLIIHFADFVVQTWSYASKQRGAISLRMKLIYPKATCSEAFDKGTNSGERFNIKFPSQDVFRMKMQVRSGLTTELLLVS